VGERIVALVGQIEQVEDINMLGKLLQGKKRLD